MTSAPTRRLRLVADVTTDVPPLTTLEQRALEDLALGSCSCALPVRLGVATGAQEIRLHADDGALVIDRSSGVLLRLDLRTALDGFSMQRRLARIEPAASNTS